MIGVCLALLTSASPRLEPGSLITLPPHVGVVFSTSEPVGVALFLPWVVRLSSDEAPFFRPSQLVIEAGAVFRAQASFATRLALRWLRVPLDWLALGGGLGMGLEAGATLRPVSSLELVARLGKGPTGFALISTRAELRMDGTTAFVIAAGATYW